MKKEIHIFDMDDTLTYTPSFADFVNTADGEFIDTFKNYSQYFQMVRTALLERARLAKTAFKRSGDFVVVYDRERAKPCSADMLKLFQEKKYSRLFDAHNGILVLKPFPGFHSDPNTLGLKLNDAVYAQYLAADNTMILTGRDEKLRKNIEANFQTMNLRAPSHGLKLYVGNMGIKAFKTATILKSIAENGWEIVHFYEDRKDWLDSAKEAVTTTYPNVKFVGHLVTNVHQERSQ